MRGRRNGHEATVENADVAGSNGLGREEASKPDARDVKPPTTREEYIAVMNKAVARAAELGTNAKELTDAIKAGTEWFKVLYPPDDDPAKGYGGAYEKPTTERGEP